MHWLIFAGLGPLLGAASVLVSMAFSSEDIFSGPLRAVFAGIAFVAVFAYVFGLIPALVAALAVRQAQARQVRREWLWVTLIGLGIGFVFVVAFDMVLEWLIPSGRSIFDIHKEAFLVFVPTCLVPTLVCWRLSCRFDQPARPSRSIELAL